MYIKYHTRGNKVFRFIVIRKDNTARIVECEEDSTIKFALYNNMNKYVGEQGELCYTSLDTKYMLMYDDAYGWDKFDEDFEKDLNRIASSLSNHVIQNDCVICKVKCNESNYNDEFESLSDADINSIKESLSKLYVAVRWEN